MSIGIGLQALGAGWQGGNPGQVVERQREQLESAERKKRVASLLERMNISGPQRAILETMPAAQVPDLLWEMQQQEMARRAAGGAAAAKAAQERAAAEAYARAFDGAVGGAGSSPYSMGTPVSGVMPPSQELSFSRPATTPATSSALSFGEVTQPAPASPYDRYKRALDGLYAQPTPVDPVQREVRDRLIKDLEARVEYFAPEASGFRIATAEEAAAYGAPAGQFGPDGRFYPINPPPGMEVVADGQGGFTLRQGSGVGGAGDAKLTEAQSKDNVFVTRARGALEVLEPVADSLISRGNRAAELDPTGLARELQSPDFQVAKQAGDEFLQAILRKDTGAAITVPEQFLYGRTYLPQPGDGPEVLEAKAAARRRAIDAIEAGMTPLQMLQVERALGAVAVPEGQEDAPAEPAAPSPALIAKYKGMTKTQLLDNIPTTEEEAAAWNRRFDELEGVGE